MNDQGAAPTLLMAWSSPVTADRLADLETWYDDIHVGQVRAAVPGIGRVSRYRQAFAEGGIRLLVVYELTGADVESAAARLDAAGREGRFDLTDAMDVGANAPVVQWYVAHDA